ncbi:MAG: hypothetical protein ACI4J7_05550 [Ruminiclostridium sp.]
MIITDILSLIISFLALACSAITAIINYKQNKKLSSLNMQSRYYEKIFDTYLIKEIPKSRNYMRYINSKLMDANKLIDTLDKMKNASLFFKYNNEAFYDELTKAVDELEKILADYSNNPEPDQDKQCNNINTIKTKVIEIYKIIYNYSNGSD